MNKRVTRLHLWLWCAKPFINFLNFEWLHFTAAVILPCRWAFEECCSKYEKEMFDVCTIANSLARSLFRLVECETNSQHFEIFDIFVPKRRKLIRKISIKSHHITSQPNGWRVIKFSVRPLQNHLKWCWPSKEVCCGSHLCIKLQYNPILSIYKTNLRCDLSARLNIHLFTLQ